MNGTWRYKDRKPQRRIVSAGASATITSHSSVSLGSGAATVSAGAHNHAGWGGWSQVLPNDEIAMVVTDPAPPKLPMEHRNRVLKKLVGVLGLAGRPKADCIRRAREIEIQLHADCVAKRDYKLGAVERILRLEENGGEDLEESGVARQLAAEELGSRKRRKKEPLAAGAAAAQDIFSSMPAALRELGGEKRRKGGKSSKSGATSRGKGVVPAAPLVSAKAAAAHGGGISADSRQKAIQALTRALIGEDLAQETRAAAIAREMEEELYNALIVQATSQAPRVANGGASSSRAVSTGAAGYRRQLRAILFNLKDDGNGLGGDGMAAAKNGSGSGVGGDSSDFVLQPSDLLLSGAQLEEHGYPVAQEHYDPDNGWRLAAASTVASPGSSKSASLSSSVTEVCGERLIAIDCEMVEVTAVSSSAAMHNKRKQRNVTTRKELARLSAVDASGTILIDELVLPSGTVSDYLTQWSGISADMLEGVTTRLADAQQMLLRCMGGRDCVLVGHGLENDLHALRIVHDRVIDTAVCFPRSGAVDGRKQSLRSLASKLLKTKIQQDGEGGAGANGSESEASMGHDSVEDASAAMRLVLMRLRFGHDDVKIANYSRDQAEATAQRTAAVVSGNGSDGAARNLREGLLSGRVLLSSTPFLSAAELASEAVRQSNAEIDAQADAKASFQKIMPEPGMFNCEKCGSDLVQHTTAQIMRADEAETVFLTCFNCDHKWALDRGF